MRFYTTGLAENQKSLHLEEHVGNMIYSNKFPDFVVCDADMQVGLFYPFMCPSIWLIFHCLVTHIFVSSILVFVGVLHYQNFNILSVSVDW